jgi:copper chaperone CopZ
MYADHHVVEVRRLLFELSGVEDVYASSAFHMVEVSYDPAKLGPQTIEQVLGDAGYLGELLMPVESGRAVTDIGRDGSFFRHTAVYETSRQTMGFSQNVNYSGRPLWNCPGFGVIRNKMED